MKTFQPSVKSIALLSLVIFTTVLSIEKANGQAALIALLVGDKVASEKFNLSMELGGNFSQFADIPNDEGAQLGINFGIAGNLKLNDNWFLSPTVYFLSQRELRLREYSLFSRNEALDAEFQDKQVAVKMNYTDVFVLLAYQTNSKKFRFGIAPQISFLKKSDATFKGYYGDFNQDFTPFTNDIDYGVIADVAYIMGKAHEGKGIHVHFRYYYGMTDVFTSYVSEAENLGSYFSIHLSLPFITDELAKKNLEAD